MSRVFIATGIENVFACAAPLEITIWYGRRDQENDIDDIMSELRSRRPHTRAVTIFGYATKRLSRDPSPPARLLSVFSTIIHFYLLCALDGIATVAEDRSFGISSQIVTDILHCRNMFMFYARAVDVFAALVLTK